MALSQHSSTFVVPEPTPGVTVAGPSKAKRETPFVIVPDAMVIADDKLEPHWLPTIDAATD